jgi:ABC-type phosphate/phosphonate transport system substrate-binding protein
MIMQRSELSFRISYLVTSLVTVVALALLASTYAEPVLRVSLMPDESPSVLRRKLKPLTDYLANYIGIKIEFRPASSGDTLVESLINHDLDLVWIDGYYFARAKSRSFGRVIPLVRREADEQTQSGFNTTPGYHEYTWAVRSDMDEELRNKLTSAFLSLDKNKGQDKEILDLQRAGRFIPAGTEKHPVIEASRSLKILGNY